jgi:hypothetical protein
MTQRLNCWLVAMWLWLHGHGRTYIWLRRSHIFLGLIPHFGQSERMGLRAFRSIEYRPPKNKRWSLDDFVLAFAGHYVVTHYRIVAVRRWATKEQALADIYWPK